MPEKIPPSQQEEQESLHTMRINGRSPTQRIARRILNAPATPASKDDLATKPLYSVVRGFRLMK